MEKTLTVTKARESFNNIVDDVENQGDKYIISRKGKPAIAIVPLTIYENWKRQRQRFFQLVDEVQEANSDANPQEVMTDVLEAQQSTRLGK